MKKMTVRDRMIAVIQGKELDRVPFVHYNNLIAPNEEIWSVIGKENMGLLRWTFPFYNYVPNCRYETEYFDIQAVRMKQKCDSNGL